MTRERERDSTVVKKLILRSLLNHGANKKKKKKLLPPMVDTKKRERAELELGHQNTSSAKRAIFLLFCFVEDTNRPAFSVARQIAVVRKGSRHHSLV
jgi:hypothetical protein